MQEKVAVTSLVGALVEQAEDKMLELQENPDLLGTAIIRKFQECADGLEHVANELELEERNIRSTAINSTTVPTDLRDIERKNKNKLENTEDGGCTLHIVTTTNTLL
jgi:hypothetical protein